MKLIILDRDGVINEDSDDYIKSPDEWHPILSSLKAIALLALHDYRVAIATNQSGIGRGYYDNATFDAITDKMTTLIENHGGKIDYIAHCPHLPDAGCECRKPNTGMLEEIKQHYALDSLADVWMVGDSLKDCQVAERAGAKPALVKTGKGLRTLAKFNGESPYPVYDDLFHFVTSELIR